MLLQSHSVNTSIESCATHLLWWEESQSQSEKNAQCEWALSVDTPSIYVEYEKEYDCTVWGYKF